ncbi:MAG TPA: HAMP domain-containing sensor histidine kinase [Ktedonobacterales bacterium]
MERIRGWLRGMRYALARVPLRWRLALVSIGLFAVLLSAFAGLITVVQERALLANQATSLRDDALLTINADPRLGLSAVDEHATPPPAGVISLAAIERSRFVIVRLNSVTERAALLAPSGVAIYTAESVFPGGVPTQNVPVSLVPGSVIVPDTGLTQALSAPPADNPYTVVTDQAGRRQIVVLIPLVENGSTVAVLQVSSRIGAIERSVTTTRIALAVGIGLALLLAVLLTIALIRAALRPLVEMERASQRIAQGALSLRLEEPPTHDEIGRLARSFNSMVAQLEQAFNQQKQFVADVSHELRTPLTALGGGLEMLLLGADRGDPEASRRLVRGMYAEVERMNRLTQDLLTLTRLDEGRAELALEAVDPQSLLETACEQAEHLAQGQEISFAIAPATPHVRADADRLRQVLLNILDNAIKHTPATGSIRLSAHPAAGAMVEIGARDTGSGIPAEALPHIFERFYRADPARARASQRSGGTGLGLAIAKGLIEAQGGAISITSTVGVGTTVTIRLPAAPKNATRATPPVAPAMVAPVTTG